MNATALLFLITATVCVVAFPRKWAPIPLLASCCYMTIGQGIVLGPMTLPVFRMVLAAGLIRVLVRREGIVGGINTIDKLVVAWALWMIFASFFHKWQPGSGPVYASGFVYNIVLVYFLTRVWCEDLADLVTVFRGIAWLLVPVAGAMLAEHLVQINYFGQLFGGSSDGGVSWRDGKIRAFGPFAHAILAGTVGAVCFPLMVGIWRQHRRSALAGMAACLTMVLTSNSSGPLMSLFVGILGVLLWSRRKSLGVLRWALIGAYLSAEMLMNRPAYYLISVFDLTGSSTGWHRARLIEMAIEHFSEWWLFGTDYTFHWIGISVDNAGQHSDIVNYYLWIGVIGGFPAVILLIGMMWRAFVWVGNAVANSPVLPQGQRFVIWCMGAGLLAHAITSISVSYMDQSLVFFWLNIGAISSMHSIVAKTSSAAQDFKPGQRGKPGGVRQRAMVPKGGEARRAMRAYSGLADRGHARASSHIHDRSVT